MPRQSQKKKSPSKAETVVQYVRPNVAKIALVVIMVSVVVFFLGLLLGAQLTPPQVVRQVEYRTINITNQITKEAPVQQHQVTMKIPAVDRQGNGVLGNLTVITRKGEGLILVSINNALADYDTQASARTAAHVAAEYADISINDMDIIYKISADSQLVSGMSAGAAMSIATVADLEKKSLNPGVIISGTINPDGSVGPVGGILAKAEAARQNGLTRLLVPAGQSTGLFYKEEKNCFDRLGVRYCTTTYAPENVKVSDEVGIQVIEVNNIAEAASQFFS